MCTCGLDNCTECNPGEPEPLIDWKALTFSHPSICGLTVRSSDGVPIFICLSKPDHGGTAHHNLTATYDEASGELCRGVVPEGATGITPEALARLGALPDATVTLTGFFDARNIPARDVDLRDLRAASKDELRAAWAEHKRLMGGE